MTYFPDIDIFEDELIRKYDGILEELLCDHTTGQNIFWATDNYEHLGEAYSFNSQITEDLISGKNGRIIMPRVKKDLQLQLLRVKDKAEVFTPSRVCNAQNNLVDNAWFGKKNVFNTEDYTIKGSKRWMTNPNRIVFPDGKSWKDYVENSILEITCGEAPYITSRYDTTTGVFIPIQDRIGLLDRKLRVISENVHSSGEWLKAAQVAFQNTYAFEWQGDSLLLAREAMLYTFIDYYTDKFGKEPQIKSLRSIAEIISWNVWQMDGLKGVVPETCKTRSFISENLFGETIVEELKCEGCQKNEIKKHSGLYCLIKDWKKVDKVSGKKGEVIKFIDIIK